MIKPHSRETRDKTLCVFASDSDMSVKVTVPSPLASLLQSYVKRAGSESDVDLALPWPLTLGLLLSGPAQGTRLCWIVSNHHFKQSSLNHLPAWSQKPSFPFRKSKAPFCGTNEGSVDSPQCQDHTLTRVIYYHNRSTQTLTSQTSFCVHRPGVVAHNAIN